MASSVTMPVRGTGAGQGLRPLRPSRPRVPHRRMTWQQVAGKALAYLIMLVVVLMIGIPIYQLFITAFKTNREVYTIPPTWIPMAPTFDNFAGAWHTAPFGQFYINSLITTSVTTAAKMANAVLCGYAFAYLRFPGRTAVFLFVLGALMIPEEVTVLPNYLTVARLGWVNTYAGLLVPTFASAFGTFLMRQHFLSLPGEVLDAARVDGAGHTRILWDIVLPMSRPVVITLLMLTIVQRWNDFFWPLIVTNSSNMRTLAIGIFYLFTQEGLTEWGVVMAGTTFVVVPIIVLYLFVQRYIVEGIAAGAVKG